MRLAAALLVLTSGCSLVFVNGPPPGYQRLPSLSCSHDYTWPIIDGVLATLWASSTVGSVGASDGAGNRTAAILGTGIALTGLAVASAIIGVQRVKECRSATQEWFAAHPFNPAPAASPWGPPDTPAPNAPAPASPW